MKLVKTDWRNSLSDEAVTDLIRINLQSADIKEYNPDQSIHLWKKASIRGRRPNQAIWKKRNKKNQQCDDSDSDVDSSHANSEQLDEPNAGTTSPVAVSNRAALFDSDSSESEFDGF